MQLIRFVVTAPQSTTIQSANTRSVSRIIFSDSGASSYHGQTSALFEENTQDRRKTKADAIPTEWVEKGLMAEASLQRKFSLIL